MLNHNPGKNRYQLIHPAQQQSITTSNINPLLAFGITPSAHAHYYRPLALHYNPSQLTKLHEPSPFFCFPTLRLPCLLAPPHRARTCAGLRFFAFILSFPLSSLGSLFLPEDGRVVRSGTAAVSREKKIEAHKLSSSTLGKTGYSVNVGVVRFSAWSLSRCGASSNPQPSTQTPVWP